MVRTRSLSRIAVAIVPFATMLATACGGSDTIPDDDAATPDAMVHDGANGDGPSHDGTVGDTGNDVATHDGPGADANGGDDGGVQDGTIQDTGSDADAHDGAIDAADAHDAADAAEPGDAADASDGADASDANDANDASDASDASVAASILGSSANFAVFSGATVQNATGTATTITGDLGTYPDNTAIGLTPPVVIGTEHLGDLIAQTAATDIQIAYNKLIPGNLACGTQLTGLDLGGKTLAPGVYCFSSTAGLTGTLTLDAQNDPDAMWVFQVGSALTTASGSQVVLINGTAGQVCNAYWQIGSAATLGTNSVFGGNILAQSAVTITTGTSVLGRTFGLTAKVSTDTNILSIAGCAAAVPILDAGLPDVDAGLIDAGDASLD